VYSVGTIFKNGHEGGGVGGEEEAGEMYGESNMEIYLSYVK